MNPSKGISKPTKTERNRYSSPQYLVASITIRIKILKENLHNVATTIKSPKDLKCDRHQNDQQSQDNHQHRSPSCHTKYFSQYNPPSENGKDHVHCPPTSEGTLITLTLLSALPDTSKVEVGLNRIVVGGKSCALRIVTRGCHDSWVKFIKKEGKCEEDVPQV